MGVSINDWTGKVLGSTFENATTAITPKHGGNVFCAIEVVTAATFANSGGLISEQITGVTGAPESTWVNTEDTDAGVALDGVAIPAGTILHGRWTGFKLASGSVIAYESM